MTKSTFSFDVDSEGHEYIKMKDTEATKNYQGGAKQKEQDYTDQRMYGPGVTQLRLYMSKLHPDLDRLFQLPLKNYDINSNWYKKEQIGKNTIANMMQNISKKAGLSQSYTCHSVRASTITTLYRSGVDPQSIARITKHKNPNSLAHYIEDMSCGQKRDCSAILSASLEPGKKTDVAGSKATGPVPSTSSGETHAFVLDESNNEENMVSLKFQGRVPLTIRSVKYQRSGLIFPLSTSEMSIHIAVLINFY